MSLNQHLFAWASPVAVAAVLASPAVAAPDSVATFNIAAQPMQGALNALSAQSGVRLLYPYDRVTGLTSPAVRGRMPTRAALEQIIAGSPLRIAMAERDMIALSAASPAAGLIKTASATPSFAPVSVAAAQEPGGGGAAAPSDPQELDAVVVTGVRGVARTVMESPTPIDAFTASDLEKSGRAGVFSALQTLAPSFNLPARAGGGTATVIATGGLRGLNPDQTLILVNGKRRHKTSLINAVSSLFNGSVPADLDLIPTSAIERIEVLRDGAAAQYGSDAIAGVINIILKSNTSAGFASASYGLNFDRKDGDLTQYALSKGFQFDGGHITLSANYKDQRLSNRAYPIDRNIQLFPRLAGGVPDPREATIDRLVTLNYGVLPQTGLNLSFDAGYDISETLSLYGFGTFSKRESDLPFTYRTPNNVNTIPSIYPLGFRPTEVVNEDDYEFVAGLKGEAAGWDWDLSTGVGQNKADLSTFGSLNASLGPTSPTSFYVGQLKSDEWTTNLDVTRGFDLAGGSRLQVSFGGQYRREGYEISRGDPASYAEGPYVAPAGQPFAGQRPQTGAQATPGFRPNDESDTHRNSKAAYGELGWDATDRLFLGAAVRYEDYSDSSGDTLNWKLTGRYELTDWLAVRAAASTGFRAPGLAQQHYAATSSQFRQVAGVTTLLLIKTLPVGAPEAVALGAEPLTPEKSENLSGGFTLQPLPGLDITVDAYQIKVKDRIAITSTLTGTAVSNILISQGLSGDLSAQYYTNAIDTRTRGLDVVASYRWDLGDYGRVRLNAAYGKNDTKITGIIPNPPELTALGSSFVLFGRASRGFLTTSYPHTKVALGANWEWEKLNVNLRSTRYGKYTVVADLASQDRSFGAKWITDLEVSYKVLEGVTLAAGANNLFNEYPDKNGIYNAALGSGHFPGTSPFGFTGGSWYARVQYAF